MAVLSICLEDCHGIYVLLLILCIDNNDPFSFCTASTKPVTLAGKSNKDLSKVNVVDKLTSPSRQKQQQQQEASPDHPITDNDHKRRTVHTMPTRATSRNLERNRSTTKKRLRTKNKWQKKVAERLESINKRKRRSHGTLHLQHAWANQASLFVVFLQILF